NLPFYGVSLQNPFLRLSSLPLRAAAMRGLRQESYPFGGLLPRQTCGRNRRGPCHIARPARCATEVTTAAAPALLPAAAASARLPSLRGCAYVRNTQRPLAPAASGPSPPSRWSAFGRRRGCSGDRR